MPEYSAFVVVNNRFEGLRLVASDVPARAAASQVPQPLVLTYKRDLATDWLVPSESNPHRHAQS